MYICLKSGQKKIKNNNFISPSNHETVNFTRQLIIKRLSFLFKKIKIMKRIFEKYRGRIVRLSADVVGVLVGYTDDQFIVLLEEGCEPSYCFSLDELEKKEYYIDNSFEIDGENSYYSYCLESHISHKK